MLITAAALSAPAAAWAAAPVDSAAGSSHTAATSAVPTVSPAVSGPAVVVLPTGDRVVVGAGTGTHAPLTMEQVPGGSDAFASVQIGGDRYVIPSEAAPYVGRSLDLSLFDVTKPAASASGPSTRIPVRLSFAAGITPTAPAGVTVTSVSGQSATGYLTPDSGKAFAQALRDSIKADLAAGRRAGTGPLVSGLTSMATPGAGTTTPVQPHYPLHILQVNTLDGTGAPSDVPIVLVNTDNARAFAAQLRSGQGVARVAVPAGDYAAFSYDAVFNAQADTVRLNIVTQDGITVPATGAVPAVTIDERTATSPVTFTTQRPSSEEAGYVTVGRQDVSGVGLSLTELALGPMSIYVSPESEPAIGSLAYIVNWVGVSPATAASTYRYNLAVVSDQISANQAYAPADDSLATLHHTLNLDPAYGSLQAEVGSGFDARYGPITFLLLVSGTSTTEYLTGGLRWFSTMSPPGEAYIVLSDDAKRYDAGQTDTRTWAYAPEAPNFGTHPAPAPGNAFGCQACTGAGNMTVTPGMLGDRHPDTEGVDFGADGTAQLYWNGQLVSSDTNRYGYNLTNVPPGPATVRAVFDYDRTATGITQSTKTHTDVTIPYSGRTDPSMTLPAGVDCPPADAADTPSVPCQILPALTLNYQLNGLDAQNTSHSPIQNLVLHAGHLSYGGVGSRARIDSAQVSASFDNGATWQDVRTHGFDGTYAAHWANTATGSPVQLRVTATDCLGGSITQTIANPYTVG
ncbi:hypothetical protein ABH935_004501 [Catenulispora sp. GAS73]|uniref:hypothetical protein n=1 Tax=Catenulispora sp. GAS73 TaxID=3156269 RepID=UPI003518342C